MRSVRSLSPLSVLIVASMILTVSVSAYFVMNDKDHDITVAWANKDCYEPFWIAEAMGYWEDEGVKVKGVVLNNGSECAAAVLSGNADLAGMGADPLLRMLRDDRGSSVICRYQTGYSQSEFVARDGGNGGRLSANTYKSFFGIDGNVTDPDALNDHLRDAVRGARVGMQAGTAYWSWFLSFLETIGLTAGDVEIVPLDFNVQVAALSEGKVDIISGGSPNTENALASSQNSFVIKDPDAVTASIFLMASGSAQAAKADSIVKVMKGLQRACDLIRDDPDTAAEIITGVYGRNWSPEQQKAVFDKSVWGIDITDEDIGALQKAAGLINTAGRERKGPLPTGTDITDRISRIFIERM